MQHERPDVMFFPFELLAHYSRCIELARSYEDKYDIIFRSSTKYNALLEQSGFKTFECADLDAELVMGCVRDFNFNWLNKEVMEAIFIDQVACIQKYRPQFVVGDMSATLKMAAEYTSTPFVSLINGYISKHYALKRPVSKRYWPAKLELVFGRKLFSLISAYGERRTFIRIHKPFREIRAKYQLQAKSHYLDELEGDSTFICDRLEIFPQKMLPASYEVIGPLFYSGVKSAGNMPLRNGKKNILVTFGSSGEWEKVRCLNEQRFADFNIVTAGDDQRVLNAPHVIKLPFGDLGQLLLNTDLLICHGGNGTLNFADKHKVPFIALPSTMEQEWNAYRFRDMNGGDVLITKKIKARHLYKLILHLV